MANQKPNSNGVTAIFRCLQESPDNPSDYNSQYNRLSLSLAKKSGWTLVEEKHLETIKGNSRDRSKRKATVEKEVITFTIPTNLVALSRNGKNDWYNKDTGTFGTVRDEGTCPTIFTFFL